MNRAERRKQGKKQQVKTYVLTDQQIQKIKDDAVEDALNLLLAIPVVVLHDKFGFRQVRLQRFMACVKTWIAAIHQDENTLAELLKVAKEDCDYEVTIK